MNTCSAASRLTPAVTAIACVLVLLVVYVASYVALVTPIRDIALVNSGPEELILDGVFPGYRIDGSLLPLLFGPAHWLDRQLRPQVGPASSIPAELSPSSPAVLKPYSRP